MPEVEPLVGFSPAQGLFDEIAVKVLECLSVRRYQQPVNEWAQEHAVERVLRVPCVDPWPEGQGKLSEADSASLATLLREHEEDTAGQRAKPDAAVLIRTFAPLLAAVIKAERRGRVVDLSRHNLKSCLDRQKSARMRAVTSK